MTRSLRPAAGRSAAGRIALASLTLGLGLTIDIAAAGAGTDGICPTAEGVTIVVDFQELGGGVQARCATGQIDSGFAALRAADIDYQPTARSGGFLCKIAGKPGNDPCMNPSPPTAYWSYWLAPRGGQWCFSSLGAGNRTPPPGTVEGWSFSKDKNGSSAPPPRFAVPAAVPGSPATLPANDCDQIATAPTPATPPAPDPPNAPTPEAPNTSSPTAVKPETTVAGGRSTRPATAKPAAANPGATPNPTTTLPTTPTTPTTTTLPGETTTTIDPAATPTTMDAAEREIDLASAERTADLSASSDGGSPVGLLIAVALVGAIAGAALVIKRRTGRA